MVMAEPLVILLLFSLVSSWELNKSVEDVYEVTESAMAKSPRRWAVCQCVCDVVHSVGRFVKRCFGKLRSVCCINPTEMTTYEYKEVQKENKHYAAQK